MIGNALARPSPSRFRGVRIVAWTVLRMIVTAWAAATVTFIVVRLLPGNPVDVFIQSLVDSGLSKDEANARAARQLSLDLDAPLLNQYGQFISNLLRGDLGTSSIVAPGRDVSSMIVDRLPWTVLTVGGGLFAAFWLGLRLGVLAATKRNTWIDSVITNTSAAVDAVPAVLLGVLAVLYLGVSWKWVSIQTLRGPYSSSVTPGLNVDFVVSVVQHAAVPFVIYVLSSVGSWTLAMRSMAVSVLHEEHVLAARARGISPSRIRKDYVAKNARLPLITGFAISLGFVVGGSVLIEQIFVYPGVGQLLGVAIGRRDYPVIQGVVLVTTISVLVMTVLADALYRFFDPRIARQGAAP